jgi:hypothetical protein
MSSSANVQKPAEAAGYRNDLVFNCATCFRGFSGREAEDSAQFWLTSCRHIICSAHIFPDGGACFASPKENSGRVVDGRKVITPRSHTCPYCKREGISLAAVSEGESPARLKAYFTPPNELLENFAEASRAGSPCFPICTLGGLLMCGGAVSV